MDAIARARWALGWIAGDAPAELTDHFAPHFLEAAGTERIMRAIEMATTKLGIFGEHEVESTGTRRALAQITAEDGSAWRLGCTVDDEGRIASLWVSRAPVLHPTVTELDTERLRLRRMREDDLDDFAALSADPEVMRFVGDGQPTDARRSAAIWEWFLAHWERYGYGNWTLEDKATGAFVGRGGLNILGSESDVEVAYVLDKPYWGRGLATEVARAAVDWGFDHLGLERIVGITFPENIASQRVLQKAGLREAGERELIGITFRAFEVARADR